MLAPLIHVWSWSDGTAPVGPDTSWVSVKVSDSIRKAYIFIFVALYLLLGV